METVPVDQKKKDPDSFSLDPDAEILETNEADFGKRAPPQIDVYETNNLGSVLSPLIASPKLHKIDSFSQEEVAAKNSMKKKEIKDFPIPIQLTLNLCQAFNKEVKTVKKITNFVNTLDDNLRLTEQLVANQEKRIDEFFQEVYDLFNKNFHTMTEVYKQNMKNRLQQELLEYRYTTEMVRTNLDHILIHDSFSKILQHELFNFSGISLNNAFETLEAGNKFAVDEAYADFVNNALDLKFGLTPLVKKYKLVEYLLQSHHDKSHFSQNVSQNISEIKKEPFKDFANIYAELESFVAKLSSNFSQEITSVTNPHTPFLHTLDKIVKSNARVLPFDSTGKSYTQIDPEESSTTRKRLSQMEVKDPEADEDSVEKDIEKEKEPRSPPLSSRSMISETGKAPVSLTPVKNVVYKVPPKENIFTGSAGWFNSEEMGEIAFQTQLISVHNHLTVGDLISVNGVPHRIVYKEWIFPEDNIQMVNIFTGERIEVKYNSRYTGMEDQIITKKYQVIDINDRKGYYLLMDMNWDKSDLNRKLPKVIEMKDVLDKTLEDDIKETFQTDRKVVVHVLKIKEKDIIVSYRKEWL